MVKSSYVFILVLSGLMLIFHIFGLIDGTFNADLLTLLMNPGTIKDMAITNKVILVVESLIGITTVAIGVLSRDLQSAISGPVTVYLFNLFIDINYIYRLLYTETPVLALIFFGPIMLLYVVVMFDFWRGND